MRHRSNNGSDRDTCRCDQKKANVRGKQRSNNDTAVLCTKAVHEKMEEEGS